MAMSGSGNPISFRAMNDELGNSPFTTLDLEDAAENGFGLSKPHGLNEFFGLSIGRTSISIKSLDGDVQGGDPSISEDFDGSWANGELYLCAGAEVPTDDDINFTIDDETDFNSEGTIDNGDTLFAGSTGTTLSPLRAFQGGLFYVETTTDKIFQLNSSAVISNVISRTPVVPTKPTLVANSGTQITVTIPSTNTVVTKEFDIHRSIGGGSFARVATVSPSSRGNTSNTSVSTTYVDSTGISAGNSVVYKVFAQNAFATSSASTTSDSVTTPAGTQWGSFTNYAMSLGSGNSQTLESSEKSLTLTNGSGNTTISVAQPSNSNPNADLEIKVGTSSGNYGSYATSHSGLSAASTYFFKTKLTQPGAKENAEEPCDIVFTNNSVQKTIIVTVTIGGLGGP